MNDMRKICKSLAMILWLCLCLGIAGPAARAQDKAPSKTPAIGTSKATPKATPKDSGARMNSAAGKTDSATPAKKDSASPKKDASSTTKTISAAGTGPKKENFMETVQRLQIKSDVSDMVIDSKTNDIISMVFSGDVHFVMDQADMYCDKLDVVEGKDGGERTAVATPKPGNRVIIYSFDQGIMAICDKYVYFTETKKSILTAAPNKKVLTYRVQSNGGITKSFNDDMTITQGANKTEIHAGKGSMEPAKAETETLPPDQKKRLLEFIPEMMKRYKEKGVGAGASGAGATSGAPKPTPKTTPHASPKTTPKPASRVPSADMTSFPPPEPPPPSANVDHGTSPSARVKPPAASRITPRPTARVAPVEPEPFVPSRDTKPAARTPKPIGKRPQIEE